MNDEPPRYKLGGRDGFHMEQGSPLLSPDEAQRIAEQLLRRKAEEPLPSPYSEGPFIHNGDRITVRRDGVISGTFVVEEGGVPEGTILRHIGMPQNLKCHRVDDEEAT